MFSKASPLNDLLSVAAYPPVLTHPTAYSSSNVQVMAWADIVTTALQASHSSTCAPGCMRMNPETDLVGDTTRGRGAESGGRGCLASEATISVRYLAKVRLGRTWYGRLVAQPYFRIPRTPSQLEPPPRPTITWDTDQTQQLHHTQAKVCTCILPQICHFTSSAARWTQTGCRDDI
jgi:hypothetical protein